MGNVHQGNPVNFSDMSTIENIQKRNKRNDSPVINQSFPTVSSSPQQQQQPQQQQNPQHTSSLMFNTSNKSNRQILNSGQQHNPILENGKVMDKSRLTMDRAPHPSNTDLLSQIEQLEEQIERLKGELRIKDQRIHELECDKDKLHCVLNQQITGPNNNNKDNSTEGSTTRVKDNLTITRICETTEAGHNPAVVEPVRPILVAQNVQIVQSSPTSPSVNAPPTHKRLGVSGESMKVTKELVYHDKDVNSRRQIRDALRSNDLIKNLDAVQLQEVVSCMYEKTIQPNCFIIREGDDGGHLYVGAEGEFEVSKGGKHLYVMEAGRCFGELALLYNCKRTASVKAASLARVWVLERECYQTIMMKTGLERIEERKTFLRSVPLLKDLSATRILRIADALEAQYHAEGECIIRQGELADSFFIIQSGKVRVTITTTSSESDGEAKETEIRQLSKGEYFGERALFGECRRTANVYALAPAGVEVLCLYRKDVVELIGDIEELKNKDYADEKERLQNQSGVYSSTDISAQGDFSWTLSPITGQPLLPPSLIENCQNKCSIQMKDLERVCVLGVGGFGRVDLVALKADKTQSFALKRLQKAHIIQTRQQEHVFCEKLILYAVTCPFICKLYNTYRDNKYVYMLTEACLGGELWTILRDSHHLDDRTARFCLACSIEALDYLHNHGIVYRDLKPENMLVTAKGYIKLCDFGFAKYIGIGQKTWTFCGTPEYVAPEVILNQGHDFAADYWSLGILTFELLTGTPPFQASEPIKIYMKTLKGIDALGLAQNKYITLKALQFIRRLCRFNPSERLGVGKHGIQEIRSHKYFQGFDWAGIVKQTSMTPFKVKLSGPLDHSNFDRFTMEEQEVPDELSGWDVNF